MGLSTTYTKVETDYKLQELQKLSLSGIKGSLKITDTAPTVQGLYILSDVGTYTNIGGLVTTTGKINYAYFDGTTWSLIATDLPQPIVNNITNNNNYTIDPEQIVPSEALYTDDTLAGDVLKRVDKATGENVNYRETTTWHDETSMNDSKLDGIIYIKKGSKYYKRVINEVNIAWFGAVGDGETDDTIAINKAINSIKDNVTVVVPKGNYRVSCLVIENKKNFNFIGLDGSKLILISENNSSEKGIELKGVLENIKISGHTIIGDGLLSSKHQAIYSASGQTLKNIEVSENKISNCILGISANANLGGSIKNYIIKNNVINNIIGTAPGNGYGIHYASIDIDNNSDVHIFGNRIDNCERHSIYIGRGNGVIVEKNIITNHRANVGDENIRCAIEVSRTNNVKVINNSVLATKGSCLSLLPDDTSTNGYTENLIVQNNTLETIDGTPCIIINYYSEELRRKLRKVLVSNNILKSNTVANIFFYAGLEVAIENNYIESQSNCIAFYSSYDGVNNSALYSDKIKVRNNTLKGLNAFRFNSFTSTTSELIIENNNYILTNEVFSMGNYTSNPNISLLDINHNETGMAFSSGVYFKYTNLATLKSFGKVKKVASQINSTATTVPDLVSDFNSFLEKLRNSGIM